MDAASLPRRFLHRSLWTLALLAFGTAPATAGEPASGTDEPIFLEGFESGDTSAWSRAEPDPELIPPCNCYFSSDCGGGQFCNWGPGGPATEDICEFRIPKPNAVPGAGCTEDVAQWGAVCDGFCTPRARGSVFGWEDPVLLAQGTELWAAAILGPARRGANPVDPLLAARAQGLSYRIPDLGVLLGRQVADALVLTLGLPAYLHFCNFEHGHDEPGVYLDLSGDVCGQAAADRVAKALVAELLQPGTGRPQLEDIPRHCLDWQTRFGPRCQGPGALDCIAGRITDLVTYMTVPDLASAPLAIRLRSPAAGTRLPF